MSSSPIKQANIPNEPALFITTHEAIPILTTLMFGFSIAMIGVASDSAWQSHSLTLLVLQSDTKSLAFILLSVSAVIFLFATEACLKSYAWDYFSIPDEYRKFEHLSEDDYYKKRCISRSRLWHMFAVWAYGAGFAFAMLGVAFLFRPVSLFTSDLAFLLLISVVLLRIFGYLSPDTNERITEFLEKKLL